MVKLPPNASAMDIEDELIVQQTMLDSLNDGDDAMREEIERTISELEDRFRQFDQNNEAENSTASEEGRSGAESSRRGSGDSNSTTDLSLPDMPGAFPSSSQRGHRNDHQSQHQNGYQNEYQNQHQRGFQSQQQDGSMSRANTNAGLQPQSNPGKRPYMPSDNSPDASRVKRHTPNHSRPQTPMLMGSQSQVTQARRDAWIRRQQQVADAARIKREGEEADAALAARLSQYNDSPPTAGPSRPPRPAPTPSSSSHAQSPPRSAAHTTHTSHIPRGNSSHGTSPSNWHGIFRPPGYQVKREQPPSPSPHASSSNYAGVNLYAPFGHTTPQPQSQSHSYPHSQSLSQRQPHSQSQHQSQYQPHSLHSNTYTLSPAHQVKQEQPRHALSFPPRPSNPTSVVDLTGSDEDSDVIDLTKPRYPMPGQYKSESPATQQERMRQAGMDGYSHREAIRQRQLLLQQQAQSQRSMNGYNSVYQTPGSSRPVHLSSMAIHGAMSRLHAGYDQARGFVDDLSGLSNLINGTDLDPTYSSRIRDAYNPLGYLPRDEINVDPEATREELRKLMENIQPDEEDKPEGEVEPDHVVDGMTVKLKPYQKTGMMWLQKMEAGNNKGGILADDMGLGKTVQAISLLVTRRSEEPRNKTTLIIAPVALLRQWGEEIAQKIKPGPTHRLSVFLHHAGAKKKTHQALREFDVVLTTFGTLAAEGKKMDKYLMRKQQDPSATPRDDEKCLFIGPECKWYRVIVDEAQCIKNRSTRTAKAAYQLNADSRFCLTGTPMMNGVEELYSLVHFLRIKPYSTWERFNYTFVRPLKSTHEASRNEAMRKLQVMLKATLLRRNKQTKVNGRPILILPERTIEQTHAVFSEDEQALYTALESKQQVEFNKFLKAGTIGRSYAHILLLLLRLRQACCHPHLIKDFGVAAAADISQECMEDLCKSLSEAVVNRIKEQDGNFECPVCFDAVENPAIFVPCGHKTCTECFTRIADPAQGMADGEETANGRTSKCPECRNPINTKSVVDYDCFKRIHMNIGEPASEEEQIAVAEDDEETDSEMDSDSDDTDDSDDEEDGTLGGFIVKDEDVDAQDTTKSEPETESDDEVRIETGKDIMKKKKKALFEAESKSKGKGQASSSQAGPSKKKPKSKKARGKKKMAKSKYSLAELKKLAGQSKTHKKMYMKMVRKDYIPSAKIEKTMELIRSIMDNTENPEKIIIFSQWTSLLDLLEIDIDQHNFGYRRYDGSMNAKLRGDAVEDFKKKPNVRMMLVSLKAGNAGLNLNIASQVIILDPFWNPYIEEQAIDRAHRLGQTRSVVVHRILVENTVEDRILMLQDKKRTIISEALDEKASAGISRLSTRELAYLFGLNSNGGDPLVAPTGRR